jgi:transposase
MVASCPLCFTLSRRIQSRYSRSLADLPIQGKPARVQLLVRRFVCDNARCRRKVFCERLADFAPAYARFTARLCDALRAIGFALGGQAGARLAGKLGMPASGDTLLHLVRTAPLPDTPAPRVVGIDDWAIRRGQNYGTIVVDLERHTPIDLLEGRESATVSTWLGAKPGIEIVARDRWGAYGEGIRHGAPNAVQVADRFHLVSNARGVLEQLLSRHRGLLKDAVDAVAGAVTATDTTTSAREAETTEPAAPRELYQRTQAERERSALSNVERRARYEQIQALKADGYGIADIQRLLKIHYTTAKRFYNAETYPAIVRPKRATLADGFDEYLRGRWADGYRNVAQLYGEVRERGYRGSALTLRRYLSPWRKHAPIVGEPATPKRRPVASPQTISWVMLKPAEKLEEQERRLKEEILAHSPAIERGVELVKRFRELVVTRKADDLEAWLGEAFSSGLCDLRNFAVGLRRDGDAVRAAVRYEWSTGQVEGQIHRLKLLKRQMYGRAKLDLLKRRLLYAA